MRKVNTKINTNHASTFVLAESISQNDMYENGSTMTNAAIQKQYDMYENHMSEQSKHLSELNEGSAQSPNIIWVEVELPVTSRGELLLNNFQGQTVVVDVEKETQYQGEISNLNVGDILQIYVQQDKMELKGSFKMLQTEMTFQELAKCMTDNSSAFTGKVVDKNNGGFYLDINGVRTFLPGSMATANKVENFELADWIGKEITVMVETYSKPLDIFIVSNKKYIKTILPQKIKELDLQKSYSGKVTGTAKFGIFVEFDGIFTGLIHKMEMSDEVLKRFENNEFRPKSDIDFTIKEVQKDDRIILTTKDYTQTKKDLRDWFTEHKGIDFDVRIKKYNKHSNEYLVKMMNNTVPNYATYGTLRTNKRLPKDDIIEVKLTGLQYHKMKLNFKLTR